MSTETPPKASIHPRIAEIFKALGSALDLSAAGGLAVKAAADGALLAHVAEDKSLDGKISRAREAQFLWSHLKRKERVRQLEILSDVLKDRRELLAEIVHLEAGKTMAESLGEVDGAAAIIRKTIQDATLPELNGMLRMKERLPVGMVGLITSFNFPVAVAFWTIAPAMLAGNGVLWKPSEKTPLIALACKAVFDAACPNRELLQVIIGGRDTGEMLVAHEQIDMISATGSVAMGQCIKVALEKKTNNSIKPILELGGNNAAIISSKVTPEHLEWTIAALLQSFLGSTGQRCTNTRRLFVHRAVYPKVVELLKTRIEQFIKETITTGGVADNSYGYGPLIDHDALVRFEQAKEQVIEEGGEVMFGQRVHADKIAHGYYVEPAIALLPIQRSPKFGAQSIMYKETFAPIMFVVAYDGGMAHATELANAPANARLVNGLYTQNQQEADLFALRNEAGHSVINSAKGTGTPAHGMGFGGNGESGTGEILNSADPLRPFTRDTKYSRIAQNKEVAMNVD